MAANVGVDDDTGASKGRVKAEWKGTAASDDEAERRLSQRADVPALPRGSCRSKRTAHNNSTVNDESRGATVTNDKPIGSGADTAHRARQHTAVMTAETTQCAQKGDVFTCDFPCPVLVRGLPFS